MAMLENKAGKFIALTSGSGLAALSEAELPDNLHAFFLILPAKILTRS